MDSPLDDQKFANIRDVLPRLWRNLYDGCIERGFDERQSFALLQTYILSTNSHGIQPPYTAGPDDT